MHHSGKNISPSFDLSEADYLFAGSGAAASLLLISLDHHGLLDGKTGVVIDPDSKMQNDKTFCFWATPEELSAFRSRHLISHQWGRAAVNGHPQQNLSPLTYLHVSSIDLYRESVRIMEKHGIRRIHESVTALQSEGPSVEVHTTGATFRSKRVFDSRPPKYLSPDKHEAHLLQSFTGYVVETDKPSADVDCIDLMDFNVEQSGHTQFVYVLPYSANSMLVELTRFGSVPVSTGEAAPLLDGYISRRFGNYRITATETGCIPMSSASIKQEVLPSVTPIGGRAGAVKPSTGYAFKNMFRHAESICNALKQELEPGPVSTPARFRLYDRLLLKILRHKPQLGRPIFNTLFNRNKTVDVLQFLDQRTGFFQDLRILLSLPLRPFVSAFLEDAAHRHRALAVPVLLLLLTAGLLGLYRFTPDAFHWVQILIFSIGLLCVGIPHGALDHLLETGNLQFKVSAAFVAKYLGAGAAYLVLWLAAPNVALLFFLLFSAWHFGEGDMQQFAPRQPSATKHLLWGALVLGAIILGHAPEANLLLNNMGVFQISMDPQLLQWLPIGLLLSAAGWGFAERRPAMVLSALMLALCIKLPLITSFGLYFIGQHSLNTWGHLKKGFQADSLLLFRKALPFTAGAFTIFLFSLAALNAGWFEAFNGHAVTVFFVFISCISFPHVIAMHGFYRARGGASV